MNKTSHFPLYIRPADHDPKKPFDGDLFQRIELANRLTGLIARLNEGCVFALEAPWGEGKTWFAKNWQAQLRQQKFRTVLIDAFKHDYVDDPFLMICSEILSETNDEDGARGEIADAGRKVAKALLPVAAKVLINLGGRILLGSTEITEEFKSVGDEINSELGDAVEGHLAKRLDAFDADRQSVEGFTNTLRKHSVKDGKPLIILIDELDRCRPDFAIKTIERIKHFFDVPGIVFVLLVNRPQLEAYTRGVYGTEVDAPAYLGKFVQFWLKLPKTTSTETQAGDHNRIYCRELAQRFGLSQTQDHQAFLDGFALLGTLMGFSLRDIERGYTLFSLAQPIQNSAAYAAWPIALKLKYPDIFAGILSGDLNSHHEAMTLISQLTPRSNRYFAFPIFADLHQWHGTRHSAGLNQDTLGVLATLGRWTMYPNHFLPWLFGRIDLNIEK